MHDKGYTYFDLPRLHYGEMRRLAEGMRVEAHLESEAVESAPDTGGIDTDYRRMRSASKQRAVERYKRNNVRN